MAPIPQPTPPHSIEESFVHDRAMFWSRFTGFTKGAVIAVVALLIGMWLFLV